MGRSLYLIIEYDDSRLDVPPEYEIHDAPFSEPPDGVIDFTNSEIVSANKDYPFMNAITGIGGESQSPPLYTPRGYAPNLHHSTEQYLNDRHGPENESIGWLNYSEILQAMNHVNLSEDQLGDGIKDVLEIMKSLAKKYTDARVRLIFAVDM